MNFVASPERRAAILHLKAYLKSEAAQQTALRLQRNELSGLARHAVNVERTERRQGILRPLQVALNILRGRDPFAGETANSGDRCKAFHYAIFLIKAKDIPSSSDTPLPIRLDPQLVRDYGRALAIRYSLPEEAAKRPYRNVIAEAGQVSP